MVVKKKNLFEDYEVHKISGGNCLTKKPLFCKKGRSIITVNDGTVHNYTTSTGEHFGELFTSPDFIICLQTHPADEDVLVAGTKCGGIINGSFEPGNKWTELCVLSLDAEILNQQGIRKHEPNKRDARTTLPVWTNPVENVVFHHIIYTTKLIYASWSTKRELAAHFSVFDSKTGKLLNQHSFPEAALQRCEENFVHGRNYIACMAEELIHVLKLTTDEKTKHRNFRLATFTKIVGHPEEATFATGDSSGRIIVWANIYERKALRDLYHWHTLPVKALAFTECGTHLFSGGDENVLVKWSLAARQKTFLPRLSANIYQLSIAQGSSLLSVATTDGKILILNVSLACVSTIQRFSRWSNSRGMKSQSILEQDPRTDSLVLAGKTGHLQFLSMDDIGRFLCTLDVTQKNFLTKERDSELGNVQVTHAKFTRCGKWLITAEAGPEESRLKFWVFDTEKQEFRLNTDVDAPHGPEAITSLEVSSNELAATTGPDFKYRLWGVLETTHLQKTRIYWAQISLSGYRQLPSGAADFARDGSLLAVSFGPALTLWDTNTCTLKSSLTSPLMRDYVKTVKFGNHNYSHLVITGTEKALSCWNIVTLSRQWLVPVNLSLLVSDPSSRYMCAFTRNRNLFIFSPSSPQPELRLNDICTSAITAAAFVAKTDAPYLYFVSRKQIVYCLGRREKSDILSVKSEIPTPFSSQLAENIKKDVVSPHGLARVTELKKFTTGILDSPAHTLPRVSLFCEDVLASLLLTVHVSENPMRASNSNESNYESYEALPLPVRLTDADLEVKIDKLFAV